MLASKRLYYVQHTNGTGVKGEVRSILKLPSPPNSGPLLPTLATAASATAV